MAGNGKFIPPIKMVMTGGMVDDLWHGFTHITLIYPQKYHPKTKTWNKGSGDNGRAGVSENWLVVWNMIFIFPYIYIYLEVHNPNWRSHIFQRGRSTTNQRIWGYMGIEFMFWMQMKWWDNIQSWVFQIEPTWFCGWKQWLTDKA